MSEPVSTQNSPYLLDLATGEYYYCACGRSKSQPFCDGSHQGTGIEPIPFQVDSGQKVALCGCRKSRTKPFCDGSHSKS